MSSEESYDPYAVRDYEEYYGSDNSTASSSSTSTQPSAEVNDAAKTQKPRRRQERSDVEGESRKLFDRLQRPTSEEEEQEDLVGQAQTDAEEPLLGLGSSDNRQTTGIPGARQEDGPVNDDDEDDTDSFYALLNVQRDATEEQIRDSYRALAVSLHPDKHTSSPELKAAAENRFRAVQRAYEVLSDAEKRGVYDHFGVQGLSRNWSMVRRSANGGPRTAEEMREEFKKFARQRTLDDLDNAVRSKGEYTVNLDASSLFCAAEHVPRRKEVIREIGRAIAEKEAQTGKPFEQGDTLDIELPDVTFAERWARVGFSSLVGKHGWEVPLKKKHHLVFNGQMASKGGMGTGNLNGTLRTQWNGRLTTEASMTLLQPRVGSVRCQYELTKFSFVSFVASGSTFRVPPHVQLSLGQRLSHNSPLTGFTTLNSGTYTVGMWGRNIRARQQAPSMAFGMSNRYGEGKGWTWQAGLGLDNQSLSVDYAYRPTLLGAPKMRLGLTLGVASGLNAFHSVERKITDNVSLGMTLFFGVPLGSVTLQLRFSRLRQKLLVPIQLSPQFRPDIVAVCTLAPGLALLAAEQYYFRPMRRQKVSKRLADLRAQNTELIQQRKQAAREAVDVLRQNARKRAHVERNAGGVVVIQAFYGKRDCWPALCDQDAPADDLFVSVWGHEPNSVNDGSASNAAEQQDYDLEQHPWCDVTIAVMMLVKRGQLIIPGGRQKHKLMGFYDPCMGERKHLVVRYLFGERLHHVIVDDITQLTAPLRSHTL
jgi:DnaJ family protein C protein 11